MTLTTETRVAIPRPPIVWHHTPRAPVKARIEVVHASKPLLRRRFDDKDLLRSADGFQMRVDRLLDSPLQLSRIEAPLLTL